MRWHSIKRFWELDAQFPEGFHRNLLVQTSRGCSDSGNHLFVRLHYSLAVQILRGRADSHKTSSPPSRPFAGTSSIRPPCRRSYQKCVIVMVHSHHPHYHHQYIWPGHSESDQGCARFSTGTSSLHYCSLLHLLIWICFKMDFAGVDLELDLAGLDLFGDRFGWIRFARRWTWLEWIHLEVELDGLDLVGGGSSWMIPGGEGFAWGRQPATRPHCASALDGCSSLFTIALHNCM